MLVSFVNYSISSAYSVYINEDVNDPLMENKKEFSNSIIPFFSDNYNSDSTDKDIVNQKSAFRGNIDDDNSENFLEKIQNFYKEQEDIQKEIEPDRFPEKDDFSKDSFNFDYEEKSSISDKEDFLDSRDISPKVSNNDYDRNEMKDKKSDYYPYESKDTVNDKSAYNFDSNLDNDDYNSNYDSQYDDRSFYSPDSLSSPSKASQEPSLQSHYVQVFDKYGNFITSWGEKGEEDGKFLHPHGIAVDSRGYVYVTDELKSQVLKFDSDGNFIKSWGGNGPEQSQLSKKIEDIDVDVHDDVYVVNYGKPTNIAKFDSEGNFIGSFGSKGEGIGEFNRPWGINVDSEGNIYVAEKYNYRISKYTPDAEFVTMWGKNGSDDGDFLHLHAVTTDKDGYVYATDEDKGNIQKFTPYGEFVTKWGNKGKDLGEFIELHGIATDSENNVYVADTKNSRIQKFTSDGEFLTSWGENGLGDGKFLMIHDIDVDSNDYVYVTDKRDAHPDKSNASKYLEEDD
ncbi:MAG: 6-bladed beta-propeller [Nitrososphaeraceae archaeon]